jgi:hypothetical protein
MPKSKEPPSLRKFAIKPPPMESLETETPPTQPERTRAKNERVLLSLRINREDWYQLHDFANRRGSSLQKLMVAALAHYMQAHGVKPITGR